MKEKSGGYCGGVPPLPIPNREVKPTCADGTAQQCGRVGSRLLLRSEALETEMSSGLFCVYPVFLLYCFRNPFGVAPVFSPCFLWNSLVFILPFLCVVSVTLFFLFYSCSIFVLSLFYIYTVFVSLLYGFFFVFMLLFCLDCAMLV